MWLEGFSWAGVDATLAPRALVAASSLLLLFWGARLYDLALKLSAFVGGAVGAWAALDAVGRAFSLGFTPSVVAAVTVVSGLVALALTLAVHRAALIAAGGALGLVVGVALTALVSPLWWAPLAGAVVGAVAVPLLWKPLLKVLTPGVGAAGLAVAVGMPEAWWLVGVLWLLGAVVQLRSGAPPAREEEA